MLTFVFSVTVIFLGCNCVIIYDNNYILHTACSAYFATDIHRIDNFP